MCVDWSFYFKYEPESKTGLVWNYNKYTGPTRTTLSVWIGKEAGWVSKNGYGEVKLDGVTYKAHRIIWELHNETIPKGLDIDHIDGNRLNNDISNLRLCNDKINAQNRKVRYDNKLGFTGVKRQKSGNIIYYTAFWTNFLTGKEEFKCFSEKVYGDNAFLFACQHREKMIDMQREAGAYYTITHGGINV